MMARYRRWDLEAALTSLDRTPKTAHFTPLQPRQNLANLLISRLVGTVNVRILSVHDGENAPYTNSGNDTGRGKLEKSLRNILINRGL